FRLSEHRVEAPASLVGQAILDDGAPPVAIPRQWKIAAAREVAFPVLHVFRNVDYHGTRPAGSRKLKGGAYRDLEPLRIGHQEDVLGDGAHNRGNGCFLECVGADCVSGYLS